MIRCRICGKKYDQITPGHLKKHGFTVAKYKMRYPRAKTTSNKTSKRISKGMMGHKNHLGCKHTVETKKKISEVHKGKKLTIEHCENISKAMKGKKRTVEHCENMSKVRKGKKCTAEHKKKISEAKKQYYSIPENIEKQSLACGGTGIPGEITPYGSDWTRELKNNIKERDCFHCQMRHETDEPKGGTLHVHHIDYDKTNHDPINLISLCHSCHSRTNGSVENRADWMFLLKYLMKRRANSGEITAEGL